jgi:hypothetical protein
VPDTELYRFTLNIHGKWSVEEFSELLRHLNESYSKVALVTYLGDGLQKEENYNNTLPEDSRGRRDYTWLHLYSGGAVANYPSLTLSPISYEQLTATVSPFIFPLSVYSLELASPGWVQIIGAMNPLKVIADFVTKWRAENTKRIALEHQKEKTIMDAELERQRIRNEFITILLQNLPQHVPEAVSAQRTADTMQSTILPAMRLLEEISSDARLDGAEATSVAAITHEPVKTMRKLRPTRNPKTVKGQASPQ